MFQPKTNSKSFIAIDRQTLQLLLYTVRDKILGLNFKISIFEMESIFCTATQYDWLLAWYYCLSVCLSGLQNDVGKANQKPKKTYIDNSSSCFNNLQHYNNVMIVWQCTISSVANPSATMLCYCQVESKRMPRKHTGFITYRMSYPSKIITQGRMHVMTAIGAAHLLVP